MQNNKTFLKRFLSAILCIMLITAIALSATGCGTKTEGNDSSAPTSSAEEITDTSAPDSSAEEKSEVIELGEGKTEFNFTVTNAEGEKTAYLIKTDKETVGEALLKLKLIAGEDSAYGLYVKTVDGVTLDFEKDGKYWAFYVNGAYALNGVDSTEIEDGASYEFRAE